MAQETIAFWVGAVCMLAGTGFVAYRLTTAATAETRPYYVLSLAVTGVGAVAYIAMALATDPPAAQVARYAAWLVVTPLVLAALWLLADAGARLLAALVVLDVLMVALAAAGALVPEGLAGLTVRETRLALWGAGVVTFLALVVVLLRVLSPRAGRRHRRNPDVAILFSVLRNLVVIAWLLSPLAWLLSPGGLAVVGSLVAAVGYVVSDLATTVGVAALLVRDDETLRQAEA